MSDEPLEEWLERAEEDYRQAQVALRQRKYPAYNTVCFHSQQCAEKYVKAFLVRHQIGFRESVSSLGLFPRSESRLQPVKSA